MNGVKIRLGIFLITGLTLSAQTAPPAVTPQAAPPAVTPPAAPPAVAPVAPPPPKALTSDAETGPLGDLAEVVFSIGFTGPLAGKLCTALGITANDQTFPVVQIATGKGSDRRSLNASLHRKRLDLVFSRTLNGEITTFLTSGKGQLEKAVVDRNGETKVIPLADAKAPFEAEKSWWLDTWLKNYQVRLTTRKR